jgi:hypothetical protein
LMLHGKRRPRKLSHASPAFSVGDSMAEHGASSFRIGPRYSARREVDLPARRAARLEHWTQFDMPSKHMY